jgi:hypothetical protein
MKASEDLQKGIQQLVDLTKQEDSNPKNLQLIVTFFLLRKCQSSH